MPENLELEELTEGLEPEADQIEDTDHVPVIEVVKPPIGFPVGTTAELEIMVRCPERCDLTGGMVIIGDAEDQVIAEQSLDSFFPKENVNSTGKFPVEVPREPGMYTWSILYYTADEAAEPEEEAAAGTLSAEAGLSDPVGADELASEAAVEQPAAIDAVAALATEMTVEDDLPRHAIVQAEFTFEAIQHTTGMSVWREQIPVPVDSDFEVNVGINCVEGCSLIGQEVNLYLNEVLLATVPMGEPVAPRLGLYWAVAKLRSPSEVGVYSVICRMEPVGVELLHAPVQTSYTFTTALAPQSRLHVSCVDKDSGKPVELTDIIVQAEGGYPYRVRSNIDGEGWFNLPYGEFRVGVICSDYKDAEAMVVLAEGSELTEISIAMKYEPDLGA